MSYIKCSTCGQRALSIATRCPRCGREFSPYSKVAAPKPERRKVGPVVPLVGALLAGLVVLALVRLGSRFATGSSVESSLLPETAATSQLGRSAAEGTPSPAEQPSAGGQSLRYATTWVNVREDRSRHSPVTFILDPGEAVLVDSLISGWYRVVADGQTLGYAARPYFEASPPSPH